VETMDPATTRLLVDVGQTGSRVVDTEGHRHHVSHGFTPGTRFENLLDDVLSSIELRNANTVVMSLTGLRGTVPGLDALTSVCQRLTGCNSLGVCDDGLAWSVGSLDGGDGVALAVGGGVVAVARREGAFWHGDGNGSDFGDSGSAYWLGRKGIRAAIRAEEGTGKDTSLRSALREAHGSHNAFVLAHRAQDDVHRVCIDFASAVLAHAKTGDRVAGEIVSQGALRLASLVRSVATRAGLPEAGTYVALGGGVMEHEHYRGLVEEALGHTGASYDIIRPVGDALDGLALLEQGERQDVGSLMRWWSA
jgi:N-acetylglucosamine kinase-like BadF-type ATPase